MKTAKKILLILISAVMMIGDGGCGKEETILNEWQKEFLAEQGLPTEYSELNFTQKMSVDAIYEMIMYLQDKYGVEFEYTGYVRPQILEDEYLTAIPKDGNEKIDTVTVTRQDDGTLTDDYPNVVVRPYYEQMITDYVEDYFGSDKINVISSIDTSINDFKNISDENIKGNVYGINLIFISYNICSEQKFNEFVKDYGEWCKKNEYWGKGDIILLNENHSIGDIDIKKENYDDFLGKQQYKLRLHCSVKKGKEINIY
ncbi:MAG: hypothetical protein NC320_04375 [Clostridium sp.]|nr:hypothetical protein [Clostridium sp.]MCM1547110.1 hypothetical protein [Ruminococcus sp.]